MNTNIEKYDELIEKFLRGEMSQEEETAFKQSLQTNAELKEYAMTVSSLVRGLKRKKQLEDLAVIESVQEVANKPKAKTIQMVAWTCSIAAVFLAMFNLFVNNGRQDKPNALVTPYYNTYSVDDLSRGEEDSVVVSELADLFNAIDDSDDCAEIIKKLLPIYKSLDTDYTYRPYANDIAWYLALAYIKNDEVTESIAVLNKLIADNPNTELAEKATKLIDDLKKLE